MKHFKLTTTLFFVAVLCFFSGFNIAKAQVKATLSKQLLNGKDWSFVENKGQLAAPNPQNGDAIDFHTDIKYYSHSGGPDIYCRPGTISFVFSKVVNNSDGSDADLFQQPQSPQNALDMRRKWEDEITNKKISTISSRADLVLLNANPNAQIIGQDQQAYHENYYTSYTPEPGVNKAHTFKTIVYKSIYPNIDMLIHAKQGGLEYEFVIYPGGNASDIQLQWKGLQSMESMQNGGLHYVSNMIDMADSKPVSSITDGTDVSSNFVKNDNIVSFAIAKYDRTKTLTIDPTINWGTYLGGGGRDYCQAVWTDVSGDVMICGPCTGTNNIGTSGAFLSAYAGPSQSNAFLAKFSSSGSLQWCTYYGGSIGYGGSSNPYNDGWGLSSDTLDEIYMGGATSAISGIASSGSYQSVYGGTSTNSYGGYVVKFRPDGSRIWATYYGAAVNDQVLFVASDASADVFISAWANSSTGLASSGAYQTSYGGSQDVGIAKYDSAGKQLWSTYYGGSGYDAGNVVATDINGNVLVCGETASSSGIAIPGAFQSTYGGGTYDAFVASFSPSGGLNWDTYLGGSAFDEAWGVATDQFGNVYVTGQTASKSGITSNIPYQPSLAGASNSFLSKFSPKGTMIWSTYSGGGGSDIANNLCTDPAGSIFITGQTTSTSGIATSDAYLSTLAGSQNAFLSKFSPAGNLMYGTYYGGSGSDASFDVHSDAIGNTYIAGSATSTSGIATSNGYKSTYVSGSQDEFVAGFFFNNVANDAGIAIMPSVMCVGKQDVEVMLENFGTNDLTSVTIGWIFNGKNQTAVNWAGKLKKDSIVAVKLGTIGFSIGDIDTFKIWSSNPNGVLDSMPQNDTMITKTSVQAYPTANAGGSKKLCSGSKVLVGPSTSNAGVTYSWTSKPAGFTSNLENPSVGPSVNTTYYFTVTTIAGGCAASDSAKVTVGQIPNPRNGDTDSICYGGSYTLGVKNIPGHTYAWSSVPVGFSSSIGNPIASPLVTSVYYETETDTAAGCLAYGITTIIVNPEARTNAGGNKSICPAGSATIGTSAVSGYTYSWTSSPAGFTSTKSSVTVSPDSVTTYYFADITNGTGCTSGDTVVVSFNPVPDANTGAAQTICAGYSTQIGATAVSGDNYSWKSSPAGFTSTVSNPNVNPSVATDFILTETIAATGCFKTDTVAVNTNPLPTPYNGGKQSACLGDIVQLGTGTVAGHVYSWSSVPKGFSSNSGYPTVTPTISTKYYLLEIITATGCARKDSVSVVINSVSAHAGKDSAICQGEADTLGVKPLSNESYFWTSNPNGFTSALSNPAVKPTGTTIYYLKVVDNTSSCFANDTVVVYVNPLPPANVGPNQAICSGTNADIGDTSSAADSFSWVSLPVGFTSNSDNPTVKPTVTTTYYLTETNLSTGCAKTNSVVITAKPLPDAAWEITYSGNITYLHALDSGLARSAYYWNLGDGDTATGHLVKHVYPGNKQYAIKLSITSTDGCLNSLDSQTSIAISGIGQTIGNQFSLDVFPNPFQASTSVNYKLTETGKIKIILFDITGKQIGIIVDENQGPGSYQFDVDAMKYHLTPGMYLLQFVKDDQFVSKHLVKM